jgi:hypothetical protein
VAELAQLADGDDWSARRPFAVGRLQEPQYGADGEGVRASIEQDVLSSNEAFEVKPVNGEALAALLQTLGYLYWAVGEPDATAPYIIGLPGGGTEPGSVAPYSVVMLDSTGAFFSFYLLATHAVEATTVTLINRDDNTSVVASVLHVTILGETIALAVENFSLTTMTFTKVPCVVWDAGGGLVDETIGLLETAGDFIAWLLRLTEQQIDYGRVNAAREALRAFKIGTYLDESITVADYIREAVLDIVPVSMMTGPRGVYPHVWDYTATADDAVAHFDTTEDPDIEREGLVTYEDADRLANTVDLVYRWSPVFDGYTSILTSRGDGSAPRLLFGAAAGQALSYYTDPVLARSVGRYGVRRETVQTTIVHDELTATRVLAWRSRRYALPSRVVEYTCPQRWAWIEPGDFVTVTDPDLAWSERLCLVQSRAWASDGSVRSTLRVQEG